MAAPSGALGRLPSPRAHSGWLDRHGWTVVDMALGWGKRIYCKSIISSGERVPPRKVSFEDNWLQAHLQGAKGDAG